MFNVTTKERFFLMQPIRPIDINALSGVTGSDTGIEDQGSR